MSEQAEPGRSANPGKSDESPAPAAAAEGLGAADERAAAHDAADGPTGLSGHGAPHTIGHAINNLRDQLSHLEHLVGSDVVAAERRIEPAWQKATEGEHRLPVAGVVAAAIALQIALPPRFSFKPDWLLPALEGALLVGLSIANPTRITRTSTALRAASVGLVALTSLANGWSAAQLARAILEHRGGTDPILLLADGAAIYVTNIIVFALWYWEWDRGGPVARSQGRRRYPDFLFAQMSTPEMSPPNWRPSFPDYIYLSFTNATAFSPTDTLPMAVWAKMLMAGQSIIALVTLALVVSHAVNILQ